MKILIKNGSIFNKNTFCKSDILIENSIIKKISPKIEPCSGNVLDAFGMVISHGFIDLHTHLREPGFEHKETIATGTRAAISGGFTTVCAMPNLNPAPDNLENLNIQLKSIKENAVCRVMPFMTITKERKGNSVINMQNFPKFCAGVSDDGNSIQDSEVMEQAMISAAENDVMIAAHCEDYDLSPKSESEYLQLKRDLDFVKKYKCKYHLCHVSCKESLELIKKAKDQGLPVTCEITPHHALFCSDKIATTNRNTGFLVNPPIRSFEDREAIQAAIKDRTIDIFATDHAPHTFEEKSIYSKNIENGASGLECAFAVLNTSLVKTGIIDLKRLLQMMIVIPGKIINLDCDLTEGKPVDINILDQYKKWTIKGENFISKGKSTPFEDKKVMGKVINTFFKN
ncbi:MAG: dihydroorotase [Oscillospiraceae bacterium]|jgi:dihydroorotase|nr:dihydroorotase [Oscillospiraceae bacterium]